MVTIKTKDEKKEPTMVEPSPYPVYASRWLTKVGNLNTKGKSLKDRVLKVVTDIGRDIIYSDITQVLRKEYPDDYVISANSTKYLGNYDVKFMCGLLATEGKVIDG